MTTKPQALNTKDQNGLPIWPLARTIDGYAYELESTHPTMDDALAQVEHIREAGDAAQAFESGRPKFATAGSVKGQPAFFAHAAAVYRVPAGKLGTVEGDHVVWADRPPRVPPANSKAAAKAARKAAKAEAGQTVKERVKARSKPRATAAPPAAV